MYPRAGEWRAIRDRIDPDGVWSSDLGCPHRTRGRAAVTSRLARSADATVAPVPGGVRRVLVVGGSSDIGLAIVRRLGRRWSRHGLRFSAGIAARLEAARLRSAEHGVTSDGIVVVDADECDSHEDAVASAFETAGGFDVVVVAVGRLGGQAGLDADPRESVAGDARHLPRAPAR